MLQISDFIICILGWLTFNFFMFQKDKNKSDKLHQKFNFKRYISLTWDDWVFTLISSLGLLFITPNDTVLPGVLYTVPVSFIKGAFGGIIFQGLYELIKIMIEGVKHKIK